MTVADGLAELREGDSRLAFAVVLSGQDPIKQLAAATQIQHHEEVVGREVAVVEADDVRMVEAPQRLNLVLERGDVIHALQVQFLDGAWRRWRGAGGRGPRGRREEHRGVAAAPQLVAEREFPQDGVFLQSRAGLVVHRGPK